MIISNMIAAGSLCCVLIGGAYVAIIVPLQHQQEVLRASLQTSLSYHSTIDSNTKVLEKQDIRISQNSTALQLMEVNAARSEVQMEHLTTAIKELTYTIKIDNKRKT